MTVGPMPDLPDFCWPVDVSCISDWDALTDPDEPAGEGNPPKYSDADKARAVALAGQTLRYLTGYRVGGCPTLVRPCRAACGEATYRTYPVAGASGAVPWTPVSIGGTWLNIGCGCVSDGCSCSRTSEVRLHGPVGGIEAVKVDGVTLVEGTDYRLDAGGRLVRLGGEGWPLCQDMNLPDTEPGTWSVSYTAGLPVDGLGAWVAGILAGEYVKACQGLDCRLPNGVTQINRDGITMDLSGGVFPDNRTGIPEVDAWVARYNPGGLRAPAVVMSLDVRGPRTIR